MLNDDDVDMKCIQVTKKSGSAEVHLVTRKKILMLVS